MIYLELFQVVALHAALVRATGGSPGLRDEGALDSALAQPRMTFGVNDPVIRSSCDGRYV